MALFPRLSTGAVAQYPAKRVLEHGTRVIQYLDGTEQRIGRRASVIRRWTIKLDQLTERELSEISTFVSQHRGRAEEFDFEDPWSGQVIGHCRFEQDDLVAEFGGSGGRMTLSIRSGD